MGRTSEFPSTDARAVDSEQADAEGVTRRGMSRRRLIRNAGIAGAAAWTAPIIVDSMSSAALATPSQCPDTPGDYYAVVWSPNTQNLEDRDVTATGGFGEVSFGGCINSAIPSGPVPQQPARGESPVGELDQAGCHRPQHQPQHQPPDPGRTRQGHRQARLDVVLPHHRDQGLRPQVPIQQTRGRIALSPTANRHCRAPCNPRRSRRPTLTTPRATRLRYYPVSSKEWWVLAQPEQGPLQPGGDPLGVAEPAFRVHRKLRVKRNRTASRTASCSIELTCNPTFVQP